MDASCVLGHFNPMYQTALAICTILLTTESGLAESCVTNSSDQTYFFAVTPPTGARVTAQLDPGERLCAATKSGAIVSAYESATAIEGCSRLVPENQSDSLIRYAEFDRCAWGSHSQ